MKTVSIASCDDHPIIADVYSGDAARGVVLAHGFKGHRRWGFIPRVAGALAGAGITAVVMDFALNGRTTPGAGYDQPDLFRANTIAREHDDLERVVAWARAGAGGALAPGAGLGLWGHSRGGVAALLVALEDDTIAALATWSAAARPDFYTARQKREWRERGALEFTDGDSGASLAVGLEYLDDLEANAASYALGERAGALRVPHLIVHGEHDLVIPIADAVSLYDTRALAADKKLLRLATGHTFGYEGGADEAPTDALIQAVRKTVEWFDEYLGGPAESS